MLQVSKLLVILVGRMVEEYIRVWIQGLVLARQMLCHLSHVSSPFLLELLFR
jgi:hypothetical protein